MMVPLSTELHLRIKEDQSFGKKKGEEEEMMAKSRIEKDAGHTSRESDCSKDD
ncbi:hypothetical protein RO3G_08087 [Rhizopus delemar RA 99-880]|uniref:Uncharacterized protein n=1 Tax=Rhizopus delemar (strain RA 99-880 / ATCC MYA-4621 / FGSC 9543 / NRRL 43880) TaxID=246409 RepID=I1C4K2_RHIO9|nr:hypothetical protein RO3G_08087 [Rhizopus delemar RA 99-880]|eukprot:EIE83382.1 hypothetical protein RO3G_08087 [Rhizopus delemar RA 99-880]